MKAQKEVEQIGNMLKIDGEYYYPIWDDESTLEYKIKFKKLKKEEYDRLVLELVKRVKDKVNIEDMLTQALSMASPSDIKKALKALDEGESVVQKRGCTALKIGKQEFQIGI